MSCKLKKNTRSPNSPLFLLIVWWLPMFDFGIFWHLHRLMGIYRVRAPVGVFEKFCSVSLFFSLLPFFFFLFPFFFSLFFFLSFFGLSLWGGGPLAPGPIDIVHPCYPAATPLRGANYVKLKTNKQTNKETKTKTNKNKKQKQKQKKYGSLCLKWHGIVLIAKWAKCC